MDKLNKVIAVKGKMLSKTPLPNHEESKYLSAFLQTYNARDFDTYKQVSNSAYLGAVLLAKHIDMDFSEFYDNLQKVSDVVDNPDLLISTFEDYFKALKKLNDNGLLDEKILKNPNLKSILSNLGVDTDLRDLNKLLFTIENDEGNIYYDSQASKAMIKLFKALPDVEAFMSFADLKTLVDVVEAKCGEYVDELDNIYSDILSEKIVNAAITKRKDQIVKNVMREYIEMRNLKIYENYDLILNHYSTIYKELQRIAKEANRKIAKLQELNHRIVDLPKKSLIKLNGEVDKLLIDDDVELRYLLFALKHNFDIQKKAEEKNQEYNSNSITKMDIIFSKYGFNFNDIDEDNQAIIIELGTDKVEEVLKQIKYSDLHFISEYVEVFTNIIISSNSKVIKTIDTCLKNKIITKEFILENNNLLYDVDIFNNFYNNLNSLINLGVNLNNKGSQNLLLQDNKNLLTNLDLLGEYKFRLDDENFSNYDLFKDSKLLDYFDNFIELGYSDVILENPKYLNYNSENIVKRIMISNLIELSPINNYKKFIGSVGNGNNFYVAPDEYDKFIIDYKINYQNPICSDLLQNSSRNVISVSTKNMPIIKALDEAFMKDSLHYVIDDVVISRKRVMRNLEALIKNVEAMNIPMNDLLFQAILYNMISNVEPEKLEQIYNTISSMNIDKTKTYTFN